jgi:two-component system response regulator PilR (NtrC family)
MKLENTSILIVDDDKSLLESLSEILQSEGYNVETARTGRDAVEKCKTQFYNLALLDIKLPDIEGTELLHLIDGHVPQTVKIIITGYPSTENAIKAINQGADAYITKPVDPEVLKKTIREKLKQQSEADQKMEQKVAEWIETRAQKL